MIGKEIGKDITYGNRQIDDGIIVDMTGSSLRRRQKEAVEINKQVLQSYQDALLPNVTIRRLFNDAYKSALWAIDVSITRRLKEVPRELVSIPDLLRGVGVLLLVFGLSGVFILEAF